MNNHGSNPGGSGGLVDFSAASCGPVPVENIRIMCLCPCGKRYFKSPLAMRPNCDECTEHLAAVKAAPIPPIVREQKPCETSIQREQRKYYRQRQTARKQAEKACVERVISGFTSLLREAVQ